MICRWKGQDILLNILSQDNWISREWVLHIYGEGSDEQMLKDLVISKGLKDRVLFMGYCIDIPRKLQQVDLVIIPSRQDSGPIVLFEAMMAAKPIVGANMGAMPAYIQDGVNGILSLSSDVEGFERALDLAWTQQQYWPQWGKASKDILLSKYDFSSSLTLLNLMLGSCSGD